MHGSRLLPIVFGVLLLAPPVGAQSLVFVDAAATLAHDGGLDARPAAMVFGATSRLGAGIEARVAWAANLQIVSASFLQVAPGARRGKSLQPYGAIGVALLRRSGEQRLGVNLAGGLLAFLSGHVGASLDCRYVRAPGTIDGVTPLTRTISGGLAVRF